MEAKPAGGQTPANEPGREASPSRSKQGRKNSGSARSSRASLPIPVIPEPLDSAQKLDTVSLREVPTPDALKQFLEEQGIDTEQWGKGNTKEVKKFWTEIKLDESGLEVWRSKAGELVPVRITHVLRAKVTSPECYERGIFLFNTWQQYGDGRKRTRNGLLSEKLSVTEMPLEKHLHEVCSRAVVEEEMAFVVDSAVKVQKGTPAPEYDPNYVCPLEVIDEDFIEHTIEIEKSKSYPGLMTMYHLYTVNIVCSGLPTVDFNTLEFEHDKGEDGKRKLKYVHAWIWLRWDRIQRYLFETSEVKARKMKGSFQDSTQLMKWLSQFNLDLEDWGQGGWKSVEALWKEVENEESVLELWSRMDGGIPLLLRVVHVMQLKVFSTDVRQDGKLLFHVWQQTGDGFIKHVNRPMSRKLSLATVSEAGRGSFTSEEFTEYATLAIQEQLAHVVDVHTRLGPSSPADRLQGSHPETKIAAIEFSDYRYDLEDSPSFKGMVTMYHLYTIDVEVEGLPVADFASVVTQRGNMMLFGWSWLTWQQSIDILHARAMMRERQRKVHITRLRKESQDSLECLKGLTQAVSLLKKDHTVNSFEIKALCEELSARLEEVIVAPVVKDPSTTEAASTASSLPPQIISDLANRKLVSDSFLEEAEELHVRSSRIRSSSRLTPNPSGELSKLGRARD